MIVILIIIAFIVLLGIFFYTSYLKTDKQLKKLTVYYNDLKEDVTKNIIDNALYVNAEIDCINSVTQNIFIEKIEIDNKNIYDLSRIYTKTDITAEKLKKAIETEINKGRLSAIRCLELYPSKLEKTNILIKNYNNSIVQIHKISRTFFGNSLMKKYNLKNIEKIIITK